MCEPTRSDLYIGVYYILRAISLRSRFGFVSFEAGEYLQSSIYGGDIFRIVESSLRRRGRRVSKGDEAVKGQ